jgi:ABC-type transporter Mla subunit MlaD
MIDDNIAKVAEQLVELNDNLAQLISELREVSGQLAHNTEKLDQLDFGQLHSLADAVGKLDMTLWQTGQQITILRPARRPTRQGKEPIASES